MQHQMLLKVRDIFNTRIYPLAQPTIKKKLSYSFKTLLQQLTLTLQILKLCTGVAKLWRSWVNWTWLSKMYRDALPLNQRTTPSWRPSADWAQKSRPRSASNTITPHTKEFIEYSMQIASQIQSPTLPLHKNKESDVIMCING